MIMALALTKGSHTFALAEMGGGLGSELELLYMAGGWVIALVGAGSFSVSRGKGLWN